MNDHCWSAKSSEIRHISFAIFYKCIYFSVAYFIYLFEHFYTLFKGFHLMTNKKETNGTIKLNWWTLKSKRRKKEKLFGPWVESMHQSLSSGEAEYS